MANFPRVKPAGWALNEILTSAQMNTLDIDHTKAPNFDEGSTHTSSAAVTLGNDFGCDDLSVDALVEFGAGSPGPIENATMRMAALATIGANTADHGLAIEAKAGRPQSGGADNNDGGQIVLDPKRPGTGGSGDNGGPGVIIIPEAGLVETETGNYQLACVNFSVGGMATVNVRMPLSMHTGVNFAYAIAEMICDDGAGISNYSRKAAFVFAASVSNEATHNIVVDNGVWTSGPPTLTWQKSGNDLELSIAEQSGADVTGTVFIRFLAHKH